jgi:hypothetical protein
MLIGIPSSLKQIAFPLLKGNFLQRTYITMGGCHHVLTITTSDSFRGVGSKYYF